MIHHRTYELKVIKKVYFSVASDLVKQKHYRARRETTSKNNVKGMTLVLLKSEIKAFKNTTGIKHHFWICQIISKNF